MNRGRLIIGGALIALGLGGLWLASAADAERRELTACRAEMVTGSGECEFWQGVCERRAGCEFSEYWPAERARMRQYQEGEDDLPPLTGGDGAEVLR